MECPCPSLGGIMSFVDVSLMVAIIGGALYLLYHSIWKKKGHCQGCHSGACDIKKKPGC